jgi:hypothetical protein
MVIANPLGILNNPDTAPITLGATPTLAKLISFQDSLQTANVGNSPDSKLAYVTAR